MEMKTEAETSSAAESSTTTNNSVEALWGKVDDAIQVTDETAAVETKEEVSLVDVLDAQEVVETKEEEAAVETKEEVKEEPFARKFAALAKKEAAIREKESKIVSIEKEHASMLQEYNRMKAVVKTAKENPMAMLEELGLTFNDISMAWLNQEKKAAPEFEDKHARAELERIKKEKLDMEAALEQKQIADIEERSQKVVYEELLVDDKYPLLQAMSEGQLVDAYTEIKTYINNMYDRTGKAPRFDEAASAIEKVLEKRTERLRQGNKKETPKVAEKNSTAKVQQENKGPKTLSQKQATTSTNSDARPKTKAEIDEWINEKYFS